MEIKRVGIYCRVSTKEQTAENQLLDLRRYCDVRNWQIAAEQVDDGLSSTEDRPALRTVMQMARERNFDALLVWRYDRFARSLSHLVNTLDELKSYEVAFLSFKDGIDTSTPQGRLYFGIIGSLAEFERHLIIERVHSGLRRARENGITLGRPRVGVEVEEVVARYAPAFHQRTMSLSQIARDSGLPRGTVYKVLTRSFPKPTQSEGFLFDGVGAGI
jgi:DNA invertase Pin-like site-specific DNA recombinase